MVLRETDGTPAAPLAHTVLHTFLYKQPGLNQEKKEFYHPGFGPHFGPIQAPSKNPRRARQSPIEKVWLKVVCSLILDLAFLLDLDLVLFIDLVLPSLYCLLTLI